MKRLLGILIFLSLYSCKTSSDGDDESLSKAFEAEVCPETGFGLTSSEDQAKIKKKFADLKVLTEQCRTTAQKEIESPAMQSAFVCSCVKISMDAYLFAEKESKNLVDKGDASECLRHSSWQAHLTCRWGREIAESLGKYREKGSEGSLDSTRDDYHNRLGQEFAAEFKQAKDTPFCKSAAQSIGLFLLEEKLCASINHKEKNVVFAEREKIESSKVKFITTLK